MLEKTLESPLDCKEIKPGKPFTKDQSWTIKTPECQRIDAFKLWCWRRLLRVRTARSSNKPIWKEINHEYLLKRHAEAETPILWPPDVKSWLIGKDPDSGKDWGQEEKRVAEDGMVGWHHELNGHESEQTLGDSEGQRSLACCSPWVLKDWVTEQQQTLLAQEGHTGQWL